MGSIHPEKAQNVIVAEMFIMFVTFWAVQIYYYFIWGCKIKLIQFMNKMKLEYVRLILFSFFTSTNTWRTREMEQCRSQKRLRILVFWTCCLYNDGHSLCSICFCYCYVLASFRSIFRIVINDLYRLRSFHDQTSYLQ